MDPTLGRQVMYHPECRDAKPCVAIVCCTSDYPKLNLAVFDHVGNTSPAADVPFVNVGEQPPSEGCYCEWPEHVVKMEAAAKKVMDADAAEKAYNATVPAPTDPAPNACDAPPCPAPEPNTNPSESAAETPAASEAL